MRRKHSKGQDPLCPNWRFHFCKNKLLVTWRKTSSSIIETVLHLSILDTKLSLLVLQLFTALCKSSNSFVLRHGDCHDYAREEASYRPPRRGGSTRQEAQTLWECEEYFSQRGSVISAIYSGSLAQLFFCPKVN
jgi:hypothetical protein